MGDIEILSLSGLPCSVQILYLSCVIFSVQLENGWDYQSGMTTQSFNDFISLEYCLSTKILFKHCLTPKMLI